MICDPVLKGSSIGPAVSLPNNTARYSGLAIDQAELNQDLQAKMAKLQLELQIIRDKYQAKQGG